MHSHTCRAIGLILLICCSAAPVQTLLRRVIDLDGTPRTLVADDVRATAIVFLGTECPISNRAIPTLNEIFKSHAH